MYSTSVFEGYGQFSEQYALFGGPVPHRDNVGFGGQWGYSTDFETGLLCLTNRYYDPGTARFLTRDPIGYEGGINLYTFAGGNPINRIDPFGLRPPTEKEMREEPLVPIVFLNGKYHTKTEAVMMVFGGPELPAVGVGSAAYMEALASVDAMGQALAGRHIRGISRPFRKPNLKYAPNSAVVHGMNNGVYPTWMDCDKIAEGLKKVAGGKGYILRATPTQKFGTIRLLQDGRVETDWVYHEVYTDGRYVYDPRLSKAPIPKGDWVRHIKNLNAGRVKIGVKKPR